MKKIASFLSSTIIIAGLFTGCGSYYADTAKLSGLSSDKINIITTSFSCYDWINEITGENNERINVSYLLKDGTEVHSYQPTIDDIAKISQCDMFVHVGGESDSWVKDALSKAQNKDMQIVSLVDTVGEHIKEEEIREGMQIDEDEKNSDFVFDEHVWLSLRNAELICGEIEKKIEILDPDNSSLYRENLDSYIEKLDSLDMDFSDFVNNISDKTILFGDRFPFRYFTDDYGIEYYAAFVGCSAETEASMDTIAFLSQKLDELGINYVFTIDKSDGKIADTVIKNSKSKNQQILSVNSMQSAALSDNETYLSVMEKNIEAFKTALS